MKITPSSTAGILLREMDNVDQAIRAAERIASIAAANRNPGMADDYANAAETLRELKRARDPERDRAKLHRITGADK